MTHPHQINLIVVFLAVFAVSPNAFSQDSRSRTWSDASGSFKVQAELVEQSGDTVSLKKPDGSVISVPLKLLSDADQSYLTEWAKASSVSVEVLKDLSSPDTKPLATGNPVLIGSSELPSTLPADGAGSYLAFKPMQVIAGETDAYDKIGAPMILDRTSGIIALSIGRHVAGQSESQRGRIGRVRYGSPRAELLADAPESLDLLDCHVESGTALGVCGKDNLYRGGEIVLLQGMLGSPQVRLRRSLPGIDKPGFKPNVSFAKLLTADTAALQINDTLSVVDLVKNECRFTIDAIAAGAKLAASPGGRYLAIPSGGKAVLVDSRSGETLGTIAVDTVLTPEVRFDPSGSKLLLGYGNQITVWSLAEAKFAGQVTTLEPLGGIVGWVQRDLILTQLAGLIDMELEMQVWHYSLPTGHDAVPILSGIVTADTGGSTLVIRTLPVPHASVAKMQQQIARPAATLVQAGSAVAIKVETIPDVDEGELRTAVATAITKVGWKLDDKATIQLVATIGRGKTEQMKFTKQNFGGGEKETSTVSITPFTAKLEIRSGGQVLWSRNTRNYVPPMLFMRGDETVQEAVKKFERPNAEFFATLALPPRILKPELMKGMGRSRIDQGQWNDR